MPILLLCTYIDATRYITQVHRRWSVASDSLCCVKSLFIFTASLQPLTMKAFAFEKKALTVQCASLRSIWCKMSLSLEWNKRCGGIEENLPSLMGTHLAGDRCAGLISLRYLLARRASLQLIWPAIHLKAFSRCFGLPFQSDPFAWNLTSPIH